MISSGETGIRGGARGTVCRAGRGCGSRFEQGSLLVFSEHHSGGHISALGVLGRQRRPDKSESQSDGNKRGAGRDERMGSDLRMSLLLQPRDGDEQLDKAKAYTSYDRLARVLRVKEAI